MTTRDKVIEKLILKARGLGIHVDEKGYVEILEGNLIENFVCWEAIKESLEKGNGNEIKPSQGIEKPKFQAIFSSSALCVNSFAAVKENMRTIPFLGEDGFFMAQFEKKLYTGLGMANIDFYLQNEAVSIGIESKFLELLSPKLPNDKGNLTKYLKKADSLRFTSQSIIDLIKFYAEIKEPYCLDVAQLIKHTIALNAAASLEKTKPILVYIYWTPENDSTSESEYQLHSREIEEFKARISPIIEFKSIKYIDLWDDLATMRELNKYVQLLQRRYLISL